MSSPCDVKKERCRCEDANGDKNTIFQRMIIIGIILLVVGAIFEGINWYSPYFVNWVGWIVYPIGVAFIVFAILVKIDWLDAKLFKFVLTTQ